MGRRVVLTEVWGLSLLLLGLAPNARADDAVYRFLAATGQTALGALCNFGPCPATPMASNGDTMEISGEGTLRVGRGDDDDDHGGGGSVSGNGSFTHRNDAGDVVGSGSWTARRLLSFKDMGMSDVLPSNWRAGVARILVRLVSDDGKSKFHGILTVACRLPTSDPGVFVGPDIEAVKISIQGGPNFDIPPTTGNPTLFIRRH